MSGKPQAHRAVSVAVLVCCLAVVPGALGQPARATLPQSLHAGAGTRGLPARPGAAPAFASRPCTSVSTDPTTSLTLGKSRVVPLGFRAARIVVGGQSSSSAATPVPIAQAAHGAAAAPATGPSNGVADTEITLLSPTELFMLGRRTGSMNIVVQGIDGRCVVKDIVVAADPDTLQAQLHAVMPDESGVKVRAADTNMVLTGTVRSATEMQQVLAIAGSYTDPKRIVNLLRVSSPQQVMLEVKIAEVSKTLLDRLGLNFARAFTNAAGVTNVISGFIGGGLSSLSRTHGGPGLPNGATSSTQLGIDANRNDGIVRVLAEPNIVAISGQSASFLSGGKIFIPVAQSSAAGGAPTITLQEKEFGVGLKFTPTVLDGRVSLKIVSEVSDLSQTGAPFTSVGGQVTILPLMTTRRVDTTVQLGDGQSFAVAGLIKNNMSEALDKFPGLGEAPVLGALFRSTEFQTNQTELMFVVTPHLVKPLAAAVALPTDTHVPPSRADVMLMGTGEGTARPGAPAAVAPAPAQAPAPATPAPAPRPVSQAAPSTPQADPSTARAKRSMAQAEARANPQLDSTP